MGGDVKKVAFHEAGHAVMAHYLGADIGMIELETRAGGEPSWAGNVKINKQKLRKRDLAMIALAGPIVECKYFAGLSGGDAVDLANATVSPECVNSILDALNNALSPPSGFSTRSMDASVILNTERGPVSSLVFLGDARKDMHDAAEAIQDRSELVQIASEVREFIDEPANWRIIEGFATKLVETQDVNIIRKSLSQKMSNHYLDRMKQRESDV